MMQDLTAGHRASPDVLEFMSEVFNSSNRESDYSQTLIKLFDLYCGLGNYTKAADCLDRAAEVDAYEPGHQKRLETLRGKIDENRYKVIASRFSGLGKATPGLRIMNCSPWWARRPSGSYSASRNPGAVRNAGQGARAGAAHPGAFPARGRAKRGFTASVHGGGPGPPICDTGGDKRRSCSRTRECAAGGGNTDVNGLTRVTEISRKLNRQGIAEKALMSAAVNEIGGGSGTSGRCVVALRKPGMPHTALTEYCAHGLEPGGLSLEQIVASAHDQAIGRGTLIVPNVQVAAELANVSKALAELGAKALLALPVSDGKDQMGVLVLLNNTPSTWHSNDVMVLHTIGEQIVLALKNAGLGAW